MLKGRLGLESARIPQADRHGLLWLGRGTLVVEHGTLRFITAGHDDMPAGDYAIPFQGLSCILLQPGTSVSHDALRIMARHGTGLLAVGEDGVRLYASLPAPPNSSRRARNQAEAWAHPARRTLIARRMYAWRMGEVFPDTDLAVLRGMEGQRVKASYQRIAEAHGLDWSKRKYDRADPQAADPANQAINHAATAVSALAQVAVAVSGALLPLGFIHEDSGLAFALDIADLFREEVTLPLAFTAVRERKGQETFDRAVRRMASTLFRRRQVVAEMIGRITELFDGDDPGGNS